MTMWKRLQCWWKHRHEMPGAQIEAALKATIRLRQEELTVRLQQIRDLRRPR